jgi:hypothetical protein
MIYLMSVRLTVDGGLPVSGAAGIDRRAALVRLEGPDHLLAGFLPPFQRRAARISRVLTIAGAGR